MTDATGHSNTADEQTAATPAAAPAAEPAALPEETTVTEQVGIRRSPRYWRFAIIGLVVGIFAALILTVAFPPNPDFSLLQVFGFLLLVCGVLGTTLAILVSLILDRIVGRKIILVTADRVDVRPAPAAPTGAAAAPESPATQASTTEHDAEPPASESPSPTAER
ncbi:hypothetical protein [Plantibacter sp. YIM 135347]|uniref:hypothetical protein n=1 Tax=Plantibacter sp. YIM 135347 TaxID=3423919 RepID=UPI003D32BE3B